ncbi:MAG: hypothetical protein IKK29_00910 [Christensenellaceae bacterium]|nr:hypothetical protein [Christensenellaceae bacterium]
MKRVVLIFVALMLVLLFVSCAKPQEAVVEFTAPTPVPQITEAPVEELYVLVDPVYYETFEEFVLDSSAIVIGEAGEQYCRRIKDDTVKTYTEFRIKESLKGDISEDQCITVKQLGGEADGLRLIVEFASLEIPNPETGKEYLLFLGSVPSTVKPENYFLTNSFVLHEVKDGKVVPVRCILDFLKTPTELETVREQVKTCLE